MKLEFCAVCGITTDLQQHHIEPVVFSKIGRKKVKGYDANKQLKDCTSMEVFKWLFDQGIISDDGEVTVCSYHHNLMHGIVKFQKAEHINLVKEGVRKARERGVIMGRPTKVNDDMKKQVIQLIQDEVGIKVIAKRLHIGIGTVYSIMEQSNIKSKKCNKVQKSVVTELL
jgi:hypothetical protein